MATVDGIELKQLVCNNAFEPRWESYTLDDLGPGEVRVRSELTAAKHGTEKGEITGESIYCSVPMDPDGRSSTGRVPILTTRRPGSPWAIRPWVRSWPPAKKSKT